MATRTGAGLGGGGEWGLSCRPSRARWGIPGCLSSAQDPTGWVAVGPQNELNHHSRVGYTSKTQETHVGPGGLEFGQEETEKNQMERRGLDLRNVAEGIGLGMTVREGAWGWTEN